MAFREHSFSDTGAERSGAFELLSVLPLPGDKDTPCRHEQFNRDLGPFYSTIRVMLLISALVHSAPRPSRNHWKRRFPARYREGIL